ncbi:MAG: hypothetical protein RL222_390 [Bacteroidota bacterium]|jgi:predicted DNA-binding transcriptional regulator YafY
MSAATKVKAYAFIIEKIQQSGCPSLSELVAFLQKMDIEVSERTVQRYIEQIRYECNVYIEYDRGRNGYYIPDNHLSQSRIQLLQSQSLNAHLLDFLRDHPKMSDAVLLSSDADSKGMEHIDAILLAISKQRELEISYRKFDSSEEKHHLVSPYALKEYQQRWYLVGMVGKRTSLTKFGLDRITSLSVTTRKFERDKKTDVRSHFAEMVGINSDGEREVVQLLFTPFQAKYIETLPLHWTQKKISNSEKSVVFEYFLKPNYELLQKILSFGAEVKVLQPKSLAKEHQQMLKDALKRYK